MDEMDGWINRIYQLIIQWRTLRKCLVKPENICILDPSVIDASAKGGKVEKPISNKLHALIEYDTVEATEKAASCYFKQ
ncbi:hypothetical protein ACLB2K_052184 [Fragaria x ananassa]